MRGQSADTLASMTAGDPQPEGSAQPDPGLADLQTALSEPEILDRLGRAARRGKLPEFAPGGPENALFRASALGHPFDRDLVAWAEGNGEAVRLRFGLHWRKRAPLLYLAIMIVTVEPGRYFLDVMIPGSWGWGSIMWWYYPLTIIPIPFMWLSFVRKSRQSTLETARRTHETIGTILGAANGD